MKHVKIGLFVFLACAFLVTGCLKKQSADTSVTGTGFDTLATTEELAQLPQANTAAQQASIEVLPVETSPVTPPAGQTLSTTTSTLSTQSLSRDQQIQTALKNAGIYTGNVDGKIGPMTRKAIETFQANNGLKVDGKVGPKTWAALEPYLSGASIASATTQQ